MKIKKKRQETKDEKDLREVHVRLDRVEGRLNSLEKFRSVYRRERPQDASS